MKNKLHLACGSVYLPDYENIDVYIKGQSFLASERPDLVEQNKTDWEHYYKDLIQKDDFLKGKFHKREIVCDSFADVRYLPFEPDSIQEILGVQMFEHFSFREGEALLFNWYDLLIPGGKIHLDVPDIEGTMELYWKDKDWGTRLMFGSQKNEWGFHKAMYSPESLTKLLEKVGFRNIKILPNIHTYPAFGITGIK